MARSELAAGRPVVAAAFLTDQLKKGDPEAKSLLRSDPNVRPALVQRIREESEGVESVGDATRTKRRIEMLRLIFEDDAEADALFAALDAALLRKVQAGLIVVDPTTDTSAFPSLQHPDIQQIGWRSAIAKLQESPENPDREVLHATLSQAANRSAEDRATLLPVLEKAKLSRQELEKAKAAFPEFAERRLAEMSIRVQLDIEPQDRLLLEDLRSRLSGRDGLILVETGDKPQLRVVVSQLRWDLLQIPERTETVSYRDYQVNLLASVLLMPRNASYMFDRTTGGLELSYAFEVTGWDGSQKVGESLLRDRVTEEYVQCSNARIQNVFGGVQPAGFVANDHMQSACAGRKARPSSDELRRQAIGRLADEVMSLPIVREMTRP